MTLSPWKVFLFLISALLACTLFSFITEKVSGKQDELCFSMGSYNPCLRFFTLSEISGYDAYRKDKMEVLNRISRKQEQDSLLAATTVQLNSLEDSLNRMIFIADSEPERFWLPARGRNYWDGIFHEWEQLKKEKKTFRILHHGDSQIEMDRITAMIRKKLQQRFGGSGPGYLPPLQLIPSMTMAQSASQNWRRYICYGVSDDRAPHRDYGFSGMVFRFDSAHASVSISSRNRNDSLLSRFETVKVIAGRISAPLHITVSAKGNNFHETLYPSLTGQIAGFRLAGMPSSVTVSFSGDTTSEIHGIAIDGEYGIAMDNIPWRGSSGLTFTSISRSSLQNNYSLLNVRMVILQFGGNSVPYIKSEKSLQEFADGFKKQLRHLLSADSTLKLLVIGPADMSYNNKGTMESYPMLEKIVDVMRRVTVESGGAFWSMYHAMGGHNSMVNWVDADPQLATPDYIHFTQRGADKVAALFYSALEKEYEIYKKRKELDERKQP